MTDRPPNASPQHQAIACFARFELPARVNFEVPRDYARSCQGHAIRVATIAPAETGLFVAWTDDVLRFTSGTVEVEYARAVVLGLLVTAKEEIHQVPFSSIRVVFLDERGAATTLPVLTANTEVEADLERLGAEIAASGLPVPVHSSIEPFLAELAQHGPPARLSPFSSR